MSRLEVAETQPFFRKTKRILTFLVQEVNGKSPSVKIRDLEGAIP